MTRGAATCDIWGGSYSRFVTDDDNPLRREGIWFGSGGWPLQGTLSLNSNTLHQERGTGSTVSGLMKFTESPSERRRRIVPASIPRTRLKKARLVLEIIEERRAPALFLCVVQKQGSPEVLFLGQAWSRSEAESAAEEFTKEYLGRQKALRKPA